MSATDLSVLSQTHRRFADLDHLPIGLAVLDQKLKVLYWNSALEEWTGFVQTQALGRSMAELNSEWSLPHYSERLSMVFEGGPPVVFSPLLHPRIVPMVSTRNRSFHVKAVAVSDSQGGWWAMLSIEDITVLSRRVEELRDLRTQQDRLMREIHHRVKNNLNMISGLITLQKSQAKPGADLTSLSDLQSRIVALSEIHDLLYHSSDLSAGSSAEYLESLAHLLHQNLSLTGKHELRLNLDHTIVLKTDTTVLLGLVQAELMTNAMKYGLAGGRGEFLALTLLRLGSREYLYELCHSGDRLPEDFNPSTSEGLGMVLLTAYADQLGTTFCWSKGDPTRFWLRFSE